jgi:hypothetical protein
VGPSTVPPPLPAAPPQLLAAICEQPGEGLADARNFGSIGGV